MPLEILLLNLILILPLLAMPQNQYVKLYTTKDLDSGPEELGFSKISKTVIKDENVYINYIIYAVPFFLAVAEERHIIEEKTIEQNPEFVDKTSTVAFAPTLAIPMNESTVSGVNRGNEHLEQLNSTESESVQTTTDDYGLINSQKSRRLMSIDDSAESFKLTKSKEPESKEISEAEDDSSSEESTETGTGEENSGTESEESGSSTDEEPSESSGASSEESPESGESGSSGSTDSEGEETIMPGPLVDNNGDYLPEGISEQNGELVPTGR